MAAVGTIQIPLGYQAPDFELLDTVSGTYKNLSELKGEKGTVVMFICNHCPYVIRVNQQLVALANDYIPKGIAFIAISSNDVERYPADHPDNMKKMAQQMQYPFPYLYDQTQEVAKAYHAACTPDFSIYNADLKCVYRGQLDDARPQNDIVSTGKDIRLVLDALLNETPINSPQTPSIGCSIKWKVV
jgi:peroxiredoxin